MFLTACGDSDGASANNGSATLEDVYASEDDLPGCTEKYDGAVAFVKDGSTAFKCEDGRWENKGEYYANNDAIKNCTAKREGEVAYIVDEDKSLVCQDGKWVKASDKVGEPAEPAEGSSSSRHCEESQCDDEAIHDSEKSSSSASKVPASDEPVESSSAEGPSSSAATDGSSSSVSLSEVSSSSVQSSSSEQSSSSARSSSSIASSSSSSLVESSSSLIIPYGWSWDVPKDARLNPEIKYDTIIDSRDNKVYKIVTIAPEGSGYSETWFAENLNYADSIKTPSLKGKSWCYKDTSKYCDVAGRLYTWAAAIDSVTLATDAENPRDCGYGKACELPEKVQGICPDGWHLPDTTEWQALFTAVGGQNNAGKVLKSQTGWIQNGNGTDAFGFSALPAGRWADYHYYINVGLSAFFWNATQKNTIYAYLAYLEYNHDDALLNGGWKMDYRMSVRCIKD
jgi:uncharacterized protein (TIGR02145 family)